MHRTNLKCARGEISDAKLGQLYYRFNIYLNRNLNIMTFQERFNTYETYRQQGYENWRSLKKGWLKAGWNKSRAEFWYARGKELVDLSTKLERKIVSINFRDLQLPSIATNEKYWTGKISLPEHTRITQKLHRKFTRANRDMIQQRYNYK